MKKLLLMLLVIAVIFTIANKDKLLLHKEEILDQAYDEMSTLDVIELLNTNNLSDENKKRILQNLKNIDWAEYSKIGDPMELLDWMMKISVEDEETLLNILMAAGTNMDGAFSEGYAYILYQTFIKDMTAFIQNLSKLEPELVEKVCLYLEYELTYQNTIHPISQEINNLLDSGVLSKEEKEILVKINENVNSLQ